MKRALRIAADLPVAGVAVDVAMAVRSVPLVGTSHRCSCCGWRLRRFTRGGSSLRTRPSGYCPRCNSKARHRWLWLWLKQHTTLMGGKGSVLHVAPARSTSRALKKRDLARYVTTSLDRRRTHDVCMDIERRALQSDVFDFVVCVHVLEHVQDDRAAMASIFELLKPGGAAVIGVPVRSGRPTFEDPTIVDPDLRKAAFGERDHWRWYGLDIVDRLSATGFEVRTFLVEDEPAGIRSTYGLTGGEALFLCTKAQ